MRLDELGSWLRARRRPLAYALVAAVVSVWTLLRFFTKPSIFDLVSQQVIVHQWLHGGMSIAHMGQTAYVPKMLLLYAPLDLMPGSPRLKLVVLALAINIATFLLIGLLAERLLRAYRVRIGGVFYMALVWFSVIAGSVFWVQFANSRNLEVAGGLWLLYLGVRFLEQPSGRQAATVVLLGSLLFFDDPLQAYMTALPLVAYAGILASTQRVARRTAGMLCGALLAALVLSKVFFVATGHWLHLSFTDTGGVAAPDISVTWLAQSAQGAVKAGVSLLAGANDAGRVREAVNLGLLLIGAAGVTYGAVRRFIPRRLLLLTGSVWTVDMTVYIASGQAVQGGATTRYLIMGAPALLLLFGAIRLPKLSRTPLIVLICGALLVNVAALGGALAAHWGTAFPQDVHLVSVRRFMQQHPRVHAYASADTAMPVQYLYTLSADRLLPIACRNGTLVRTYFSMDKEFAARAAGRDGTAAIIFDGDTITNAPNTCTVRAAVRQFGVPTQIDHTDDGSTILYYPRQAIRLAG